MSDVISILFLVLFVTLVVVGVWLTARHHRRTWGDGPGGQDAGDPYEPKLWLGQGHG